MERRSARNGTIDFLRFIFCFIIALRHSEYVVPAGTFDYLRRGALCVEFFFLVSGYLMVCSAERRLEAGNVKKAGSETTSFLYRKIAALLPTLPVTVVLSCIVLNISNQTTGILNWAKALGGMLWDFLLIPAAGFGTPSERWYIGCMLLTMLIFYPIVLKRFDIFTRVIAPLIAILVLGYIFKNYRELTGPHIYLGHMYKGVLRGFGELALGAAMHPFIKWLKTLRFTAPVKLLITLAEILCVAVGVFLMVKVKGPDYDFYILFIIAVLVALAFSHQGLFAKYMDNKFNYFLGKISITLYLSNVWVAKAVGRYYNRFCEAGLYGLGADKYADRKVLILIYIAAFIITTVIVYLLSALIKTIGKRIDKTLKEKYSPARASDDMPAV